MTNRIGAALLAATLAVGVPSNGSAAAAAAMQRAQSPQAADLGGRRHHRNHDRSYADRSHIPHYYGRPDVYAPAPFIPIPPFFGYGWDWW